MTEKVGAVVMDLPQPKHYIFSKKVTCSVNGVGWNHHHSIVTKISEYHHKIEHNMEKHQKVYHRFHLKCDLYKVLFGSLKDITNT